MAMLVDFWTDKPIKEVPFKTQYAEWMGRLSPQQLRDIKAELNALIDGTEVNTSSWMPGEDWTGTPYEPIYTKATRCDESAAARCFGLMVWEVFMERREVWTSEHFEKDGVPIRGRTYFIRKRG